VTAPRPLIFDWPDLVRPAPGVTFMADDGEVKIWQKVLGSASAKFKVKIKRNTYAD
jgi:hypothetical protein